MYYFLGLNKFVTSLNYRATVNYVDEILLFLDDKMINLQNQKAENGSSSAIVFFCD